MNILILSKYHTLGGTETLVFDIANQLHSYNKVFLLLRVKQRFTNIQLGLHKDIFLYNVLDEGFLDYSKISNLLKLDWKKILTIVLYIHRNKIDLIYAHDASISIAALLKMLTRKKLVWHNHNGEMLDFSTSKIRRYKKYTFNTNLVISINKELTNFCKKNFTSIDSYVTINNFLPKKNIFNNSPIIKYKADSFNAVHVGNFRSIKNQLFLIDVWATLCSKYPNSILTLFGNVVDDHYFNLVKKRIHDLSIDSNVKIYHNINVSTKTLEGASLGILCSKSEGFGLVLLEYAQAGLPVLTVNVASCMDIIDNGELGYYYEHNNVNDFIEKAEYVLNNRVEVEHKIIKLRNKIRSKYTINSFINDLVLVFNNV